MRFGVFYRTATISHSFYFCYQHALAFVRGIPLVLSFAREAVCFAFLA